MEITRMKRWLWLILGLGLLALGYGWWRSAAAPAEATAEASLISLLADESTAGYARALEPGTMEFPRDLGPHPDYQTEWWYYTGNLATADGRPFGYQLTFFRRALTPPMPEAPSASQGETASPWRTNQVYLAHFTISDIATGAFYPAERFSRGAAGLAGAQAVPYRVWLEDWSVEESGPGMAQLHAQTAEVALDLELRPTLPPVLHGDAGLSAKGEEPGNASYYYSIVRQETTGTVRVGDQTYAVTGLSWKDHEYSTSALSEGAVGWDWFSLQLDNGAALMFFQIRRQDGTLEPASSGSFITADGEVRPLRLEEWQMEVLDTWTSPASGAQYPAAWRLRLPALELELTGRPLMPNQELNVSTVYWEGAVAFSGIMAGRPVTARGYIEMTGYSATMKGRL
jgi:predicted secreted hydrolase